jgi:hypothetical protein
MRTVLTAIVAVAFVAGPGSLTFAADEKKPTPQQERMKACNAQASDKKGDERKAFMSKCLKGEDATPMTQQEKTPMTQQEKMKKCNADATAKALKGDDRKAFMSDCLKADKKS